MVNVRRVLVSLGVAQVLAFLGAPIIPLVLALAWNLPPPVGPLVYAALTGIMVWVVVEIAKRLMGEKAESGPSSYHGSSSNGLELPDLALVLKAKDEVLRIRRCMHRISDALAAEALSELARITEEGLASLPSAPQRMRRMRRLLDYHLPRVAELAEGLAAIGDLPDQEGRAARISQLLAGLAEQLRAYRDGLSGPDLRLLDVEIKLLESTLEGERVSGAAADLLKVDSAA